jgi:hypothetical protein
MMHASFDKEKAIRDLLVMQKLKVRSEQDKGLTQFVQSIIKSIICKPDIYELSQIIKRT